MAALWADLRYALRLLAKSPLFTIIAGLTLALGIGGNTAIFTVLDSVVLEALPYPAANRLVWFEAVNPQTGEPIGGDIWISPADFLDYRAQTTLFERLAGYVDNPVNLTRPDESERIPAATVSSEFFGTLGVSPSYGRTFQKEDEQVTAPETAMISYGLWQSRFGGDPHVVGQAIILDDRSTTLIGILPRGFQFPAGAELWRPLPLRNPALAGRRFHFIRVIGRLKPGVTLPQAQAEVTAISLRLQKQYPETNAGFGVRLVALQDHLVAHVKPTLTVLMAAVGFVLLLACVNVANLLLAKAASREREIAIRTSLGASPFRLLRQLLTESMVLAVLAGALGLLLGYAGVRIILAFNPGHIPRLREISLNPAVLGFSAGISLLTGLIFGIFPAWKTLRPNLSEILKEGSRGSRGAYSRMFHRLLIMMQVAVALILLVGAGLFVRTFDRLETVDPGFQAHGLLTMEVQIPFKSVQDRAKWAAFFRELQSRIQSLPMVQSAAIVSEVPLGGINRQASFTIDGRPQPAPGREPLASHRRVSPDYFRTMGIPLLKGRHFTDADDEKGQNVLIVSNTFAREYFPLGDAIGHRLTFDFGEPWTGTIIGIVGDIHHEGMAQPPGLDVYVPETQSQTNGAVIVVRSSLPLPPLVAAVKQQVRAMNPTIPVYKVRTMDELVSASIAPVSFRTVLMGIFALLALALAVGGIYGVTSYSVSRRSQEIGIRMALGAHPRQVLALVVKEEMVPACMGAVVGLVAALGFAQALTALLFGISPADPVTFTAVALFLALVALVACYLPARRAARIDPIVVLRYE